MSNSLLPHELQHAMLPCPSPSPRVCSKTCVHWVSDAIYLILCHSHLLLPSIFPSVRVFSSESALCIRWAKYCSFSFRISPSNEYSRLISFRIGWFDLLAVQGTLKCLPQHHNPKASVLRCSVFFMSQFSHPYTIIGKTIALTIQNFIGKVMSLLFHMLSRFVIAFLPRGKHLNFMATVHSQWFWSPRK